MHSNYFLTGLFMSLRLLDVGREEIPLSLFLSCLSCGVGLVLKHPIKSAKKQRSDSRHSSHNPRPPSVKADIVENDRSGSRHSSRNPRPPSVKADMENDRSDSRHTTPALLPSRRILWRTTARAAVTAPAIPALLPSRRIWRTTARTVVTAPATPALLPSRRISWRTTYG